MSTAKQRILAPEVLPRCPICEVRIPCFTDTELARHVNTCFNKHVIAAQTNTPHKYAQDCPNSCS